MIVPSHRLMWGVAAVLLPAATIGALVPGAGLWAGIVVGAALLAATVDAALAPRGLSGIRVSLPPLVRMSRDRESAIELRIHNEPANPGRVRLGLALPREIESPHEDLWVDLPPGATDSRVTWKCTPARRGLYPLDRCYIEKRSALGLWDARDASPSACELRVYPNLVADSKKVAPLFLRRGELGMHARRQVGRGREFEKLREYVAGDDFDEIHWKATARRGRPITKVFQVERTQEVYVIVDASRLTARPSGHGRDSILERYVTAALLLGLAAERQGDRFGLVTFAGQVLSIVRAGSGKAHYGACRDSLYRLEPHLATPDFDELSTLLGVRLRRRAMLVFLTALDEPALAESFLRNAAMLRRQHLVLAGALAPPDARPLFTAEPESLDDLYAGLGGHFEWRKLRELALACERKGVRLSLLDADRLSAQMAALYLDAKQRQLL